VISSDLTVFVFDLEFEGRRLYWRKQLSTNRHEMRHGRKGEEMEGPERLIAARVDGITTTRPSRLYNILCVKLRGRMVATTEDLITSLPLEDGMPTPFIRIPSIREWATLFFSHISFGEKRSGGGRGVDKCSPHN
jgi:hypothetical protein